MSIIPLTATDPDALTDLPNYVFGSAVAFGTLVNTNQDALLARIRQAFAGVEGLAGAIGFGALSGGAITAGAGLSVNVAALTAVVGTPVGFTASQIVGGLTDNALNYLYLRQDWTWTVNTSGTLPSGDGHGTALLWGTATTSGGSVSATSNVRKSFLQQLAKIPLLTADPADALTGEMWGRTDTTTIHIQGLGTFAASGGGSGNMNWLGTYDNTHTYSINDVVISAGVAYIAIASTVGHTPPNVTYWTPLGAVGATGATGATGPTGPSFSPVLNWLGAWSSGTTYNSYDLVSYNGSAYISIATGINQNPATQTAYWTLFASKGDTGSAGSAGSAGAAGAAILFTSGIPSNGTGANGDAAIDPATGDLFAKAAGSWAYEGNLRGPQGTTGLQGATGNLVGSVQSISFVFNNGSSALSAGQYVDVYCEYGFTINANTVLADQSGSVVIDIRKCTYAQFDDSADPVSGDSICASAKPTISSATKSQDTTLTGWSVSVAAGSVLRGIVSSATTITQCTLSLKVTRT